MIERLQTSAEQRELLDKLKISSVEELIYADLRRSGWQKGDAFYAAFHHMYSLEQGVTRSQQRQLIKQLENDVHIKARINDVEVKELSGAELAKETSKEKVLSDLVLAKKGTKEGSKEWIDLTKMIADYTKIKQDDIKTDEQPIRYYLPVNYPKSCKDCLIMQNKIKKNQ